MVAVCVIYRKPERLETAVVRAGCLHGKSEYICAVILVAADLEKQVSWV